MEATRPIDVCMSPDLLHLYALQGTTVVVVDVLRATSCMVTALAHGADHIIPYADLEQCRQRKADGYLTSGERNGQHVEGFDKGNSPFEYMGEEMKGCRIAFTTTNGTQALHRSSGASEIVVGSFLNLKSVVDYLRTGTNPVLIVCAGWKGKVNLEDTLFAGAVTELAAEFLKPACDAPLMAQHLYRLSRNNPVDFLKASSHVQRLARLQITKDIAFCVTESIYDVLPIMKDGQLVNLKK
ncbi:MAG: 2-phosphosulfolactate phosphatase [Cyclobacteriaceae bacterium]